MSIVKMRRVRLIALSGDRDRLMDSLLRAGCVEVSEPETGGEETFLRPADSELLSRFTAEQTEFSQALSAAGRYAPRKKGFLAPRRAVKESELMDEAAAGKALALAREINDHMKAADQLSARETRLQADKLSLEPWSAFDVPLEETGTARTSLLLGTIPNTSDFGAMAAALERDEAAGEDDLPAAAQLLGQDTEQQYVEAIVLRDREQDALAVLRSFGFAFAQFRGLTGTVRENLRRLDGEIEAARREREAHIAAVKELGPRQEEMQLGADYVRQRLNVERAKERLLGDGAIVCLEGWVQSEDGPGLEKVLSGFDCAWELTDPAPEEIPQVPVRLRNGPVARCMNTVTDMYSLPAYDGIDPNPLMFPFFVVFFGMMMADMAYGIIMMAATAFVLLRTRPREGTRNFMELFFWCGISTFIWGALTGGFLGDFIPQLCKLIDPESTFTMPSLFTPLDDTIAILLGSLVLGAIQIVTGMAISVWYKTKNGDFIDALFNEITWWIILAGAALAIFGAGSVAGVPVVLIAGVLMLVLGGTRKAKGFGKVASLIGLVYNGVSGFFSDILSYLRLMALMLAGSVIASVFNTLGSVLGSVAGFVIISLIGNALNLALNLLGCYVHDLRLQCLEYFGRFYKEGGKPFRPLRIDPQYVDILKEEH